MSRPLNARRPSATELRRVHRWLEGPLQSWQRRRAEALLLHAAGLPASAMSQLLQVHVNTIYADLRDFAQHGLSSLRRRRRVGAPPRLSQGQIDTIWRLASHTERPGGPVIPQPARPPGPPGRPPGRDLHGIFRNPARIA